MSAVLILAMKLSVSGGTDLVRCLLVLPRFSSGLFRAIFAMKEIENGKEIHRRVSA
jgi:hypothetical protein